MDMLLEVGRNSLQAKDPKTPSFCLLLWFHFQHQKGFNMKGKRSTSTRIFFFLQWNVKLNFNSSEWHDSPTNCFKTRETRNQHHAGSSTNAQETGVFEDFGDIASSYSFFNECFAKIILLPLNWFFLSTAKKYSNLSNVHNHRTHMICVWVSDCEWMIENE